MQILILSGSSRKNSNSLLVSKYLTSLSIPNSTPIFSIVDLAEEQIPTIGRGSIDPENLSDFQINLLDKWQAASLVIIAAPEYNWSTNSEVINLAHQLGTKHHAHLFHDKVFAFVGVSTGRGGRQSALELMMIFNKIISFTNNQSIVCPRLWESHETHLNIKTEGLHSENTTYQEGAQSFLDYAVAVTKRWQAGKVL
jgi:chromate reductase